MALLQQLAYQPGIGAVGLRPILSPTRILRVGRLGDMRFEPRGGDFFDHIPPAGAALHR
jgi:hypothetical protein